MTAWPTEVVHTDQVFRQSVSPVVSLVTQVTLILDLLSCVLLQVVALQSGLGSAGEVASRLRTLQLLLRIMYPDMSLQICWRLSFVVT